MAETKKDEDQQVQPGQVVAPYSEPAPVAKPQVAQPEPTPAVAVAPDEVIAAEQKQTMFSSGDVKSTDDSISWTASEFIAHEKSMQWYVGVGAAATVGAALVFLITRDAITAGVILFVAALFGYYGSRQPRQLTYKVDGYGVQVGEKRYPYEAFKSFSLIPEGAFSSISLLPLKRFAPLVTIYFAPDNEEDIVEMLADRLPGEVAEHDIIDKLMRRVRF